jgi:hypothetical protein
MDRIEVSEGQLLFLFPTLFRTIGQIIIRSFLFVNHEKEITALIPSA